MTKLSQCISHWSLFRHVQYSELGAQNRRPQLATKSISISRTALFHSPHPVLQCYQPCIGSRALFVRLLWRVLFQPPAVRKGGRLLTAPPLLLRLRCQRSQLPPQPRPRLGSPPAFRSGRRSGLSLALPFPQQPFLPSSHPRFLGAVVFLPRLHTINFDCFCFCFHHPKKCLPSLKAFLGCFSTLLGTTGMPGRFGLHTVQARQYWVPRRFFTI